AAASLARREPEQKPHRFSFDDHRVRTGIVMHRKAAHHARYTSLTQAHCNGLSRQSALSRIRARIALHNCDHTSQLVLKYRQIRNARGHACYRLHATQSLAIV
ncbi:hypothetical protein AB4084_25655, partial [Lysobacter sp. 2RAB21]